MLTTSSAISVQYVERTERILVHSERSAPPRLARPGADDSVDSGSLPDEAGEVVVVAIAQTPLPAVLGPTGTLAAGTSARYSTLSPVSSMNASSSEARIMVSS